MPHGRVRGQPGRHPAGEEGAECPDQQLRDQGREPAGHEAGEHQEPESRTDRHQTPQSLHRRTRMISDRVMMKVLSVLKSRTRTAGFWGVIIVDTRSTGVEMSTNGKAGCMIDSTGWLFTAGLLTSSA